MLVKRAYDIYLRGCGIKRMGRELRQTMKKALHYAIRQRQVIIEDELNTKKTTYSIARISKTPKIIIRKRGPRSLIEIPPSEILLSSQLVILESSYQKGNDDHLHAILDIFDLKRLTAPTRTRILEIIDLKIDYVFDWLEKMGLDNEIDNS